MSHWLDDAARGLAEGSHSRRDVLRRGGAVAAGAVLGSVTGSLSAFTPVALAAGCATVPCDPSRSCCAGRECWNPASEQCCEDGHICKLLGETCCKNDCCDNTHEHCCAGECISKSRKCCGPDSAADGTKCGRNQECCRYADREHRCYSPSTHHCCGSLAVCKNDERCCGSPPKCIGIGEDCCESREPYKTATQKCCPSKRGPGVCEKTQRCCDGPDGAHCCEAHQECCGEGCCEKGKCRDGVCLGGNCGGSRCPPDQFCCNPQREYCGRPGAQCPGDCDAKPGETIGCCPSGQAGTCGVNQGESHPACRGGQFGCICSNGSFCPVGGCCDIFGDCKNPC